MRLRKMDTQIIITDVFDAQKLLKQSPGLYRVLSIGNYNKTLEPVVPAVMAGANERLYLEFDDVTEDLPMYLAAPERFRMAREEDCRMALDFLGKGGLRLVHCNVGVSRSPAVVLGYLLSQHQDYRDAVQKLLQIKAYVKPNPHVLKWMCRILGREAECKVIMEYLVMLHQKTFG